MMEEIPFENYRCFLFFFPRFLLSGPSSFSLSLSLSLCLSHTHTHTHTLSLSLALISRWWSPVENHHHLKVQRPFYLAQPKTDSSVFNMDPVVLV